MQVVKGRSLGEVVEAGWAEALAPVSDEITAMGEFLRGEARAGRGFLPRGEHILRAFTYPFETARVLIVGQDPYPTPGHASGLCFSVDAAVRPLPPSLVNIFKEIETDLGIARPDHGCLLPWAHQGVLLLNTVLTVERGRAGSHRGQGWEVFTDAVIDRLTISGNYVGKTLSGYAGNGLDGISVGGGNEIVIGESVGFADGTTGNVIATNGGVGVSACGDRWHPQGPQQVTVRGNQIYDNGRMPAFDLSRTCATSGASDGITMNDLDDSDVGPNGLLNSPTLVVARPAPEGRSLLVLWTGDRDQAPANYQVDVYAANQCRGYTTDGRLRVANRAFTFPLSSASEFDTLAITVPLDVADLRHYTATFTDQDGNTSEFGNCISAASDPEVIILKMAAGIEVQAPGLLAKLSSTIGKRSSETEISLFATSTPSSSASDSFEETIARSPGGTYVQPQSTVGPTWNLTPADPSPVAHDVCLDASDLGNEALEQTVLVSRSPHTGGLWSPVDTYTRTVDGAVYACADGIPVFGHYALGSGAAAGVMPPQLLSPESGLTILSTTPYLEWASVDGASGYDVQIAFDRSFTAILRDTMGIPGPPWIVKDQLPTSSIMHWRVRAVVDAGTSPWSPAYTFTTDPTAVFVEGSASIPENFGLTSIYPNPSNGDAQVQFALPEATAVSIHVFDVLGRRVGVVVEGSIPAGTHQARFDAAVLPSGLYLVRMQSGEFVQTRSVMVVR